MGKITVKAARVNAGLTQEELANKMGVHRSTISSWETNPSTMQIKDAELLCKILNIPISNIFFGCDSTKCWIIIDNHRKEHGMDKDKNSFFSTISGSFIGCIGAYGLLNFEKFAEKNSWFLYLFGWIVALVAIGVIVCLITKHKLTDWNAKCHKWWNSNKFG